MGITVQHQPDPRLLGLVAQMGGGEDLRRYREQRRMELLRMQQQEALAREHMAQRERAQLYAGQRQAMGMQAQAARDARLQNWQQQRDEATREHQLGMQGQGQENAIELEGMRQEGWENRFTAQQEAEIGRINQALDWVESQPNWSDQQKQDARWQLEQRRAGIAPRPVPKKPSEWPEGQEPGKSWVGEDGLRRSRDHRGDEKIEGFAGPFPEGQGIGQTWRDELSGAVMHRKINGETQVLVPPPKTQGEIGLKDYMNLYEQAETQLLQKKVPVTPEAIHARAQQILQSFEQRGQTGDEAQLSPEALTEWVYTGQFPGETAAPPGGTMPPGEVAPPQPIPNAPVDPDFPELGNVPAQPETSSPKQVLGEAQAALAQSGLLVERILPGITVEAERLEQLIAQYGPELETAPAEVRRAAQQAAMRIGVLAETINHPFPMPSKKSDLEVGAVYFTSRGRAVWDGQQFHEIGETG